MFIYGFIAVAIALVTGILLGAYNNFRILKTDRELSIVFSFLAVKLTIHAALGFVAEASRDNDSWFSRMRFVFCMFPTMLYITCQEMAEIFNKVLHTAPDDKTVYRTVSNKKHIIKNNTLRELKESLAI